MRSTAAQRRASPRSGRSEVLLLKGVALAADLWPPGTRALGDADLLVRRADRARAGAAFARAGFTPSMRADAGAGDQLRRYHEATLVRSTARGERLEVDLHWALFGRSYPFRAPVEDLIARARPIRLAGAPALALRPEDQLVHLATQVAVDSLAIDLRRALDARALVERGLDWRAVRAAARSWGAAGPARLLLGLAGALGAPVPGEVLGALERACPGSGAASRILADPRLPLQRVRPRPGALAALAPLLLPHARHGAAVLAGLAIPIFGTLRFGLVFRPGDRAAARRVPYRLRALASAPGFAVLLAAHETAHRLGRHHLAARLRERFWDARRG